MPRKKRTQAERERAVGGAAEPKPAERAGPASGKGGFKKPLSSRQFILDHLTRVGEDYPASMHRAYKTELKRIGEERVGLGSGPPKRYKPPTYHSFQVQVWKLAREGLIKRVGEEETEGPRGQFSGFEEKPLRHYFALA